MRTSLPRLLVAAMFFALPVSAAAPISGDDRQYDFFQDLDTEITDRFTKLVWDRPRVYPPAVTYAAARLRCASAGKRLPTAKELLTLVDEEPHEEYDGSRLVVKRIDPAAFRRTPTDVDFWSSSVLPNNRIVTVSFGDGEIHDASEGGAGYVRCVFSLP